MAALSFQDLNKRRFHPKPPANSMREVNSSGIVLASSCVPNPLILQHFFLAFPVVLFVSCFRVYRQMANISYRCSCPRRNYRRSASDETQITFPTPTTLFITTHPPTITTPPNRLGFPPKKRLASHHWSKRLLAYQKPPPFRHRATSVCSLLYFSP